jgi:hypothetical protein
MSFGLGPWETFWVLFYGFATYGNAGFMREQVCKYMCPYARFQSAMFDKDTLIITYDTARGEPRGSRSKKADPKAAGPGRVHRLQPVRAGLPHRHRHPQGPAVRMHRLRRLRGRVRRRDGQDELPARPGALRHAERPGPAGLTQAAAAAPHVLPAARHHLHGDPAAHRHRRWHQHRHAHAVPGQRRARPRRDGAPGGRRLAGKRLPRADHERHREAADLHRQRRRPAWPAATPRHEEPAP